MNYLETQNSGNGFWGTMEIENLASECWPLAMSAIMEDTGANQSEARDFLDSTCGRHFASTVIDFLPGRSPRQAVQMAIRRWNSWKITESRKRELGLPFHMPYLQGMVYAASNSN